MTSTGQPMTSRTATNRPLRAAIALGAMVGALTFADVASADPKACVDAHATGQRESKAGHLRLATDLFTKCGSDESCPEEVRRECTEMLLAARNAIPTVIISVVDEGKRDVTNVKVFSSDELLAETLDGRAIPIDPGKHHLRVVLPWGQVLASNVVIREGEKNRMIRLETGAETASSVPPSEPAPAPKKSGPPPLGAWIATGVAGAALASGITFAMLGKSKQDELEECRPSCSRQNQGVYDNAKTLYLVGDISFGVSIVSAVVATWLFLAPRSTEQSAATTAARAPRTQRFTIGGAPTPGGGQFGVAGTF